MLDESLRQRLEALNRGPLPMLATAPRPVPPPAAAVAVVENVARLMEIKVAQVGKLIPGIVRMGQVVTTPVGEHLRIRLSIDTLWAGGTQLVVGRQNHLRECLTAAGRAIEPAVVMSPEFAALVSTMPDRMVLLDLETCGLSGAALFLAGVLRCIAGTPTIELLLARNYAEEHAVLASLWQIMAEQDALVTFNGKAFDWPMVLDRSAAIASSPPVHRGNCCTSTCCIMLAGDGGDSCRIAACKRSNRPFAAAPAPETSLATEFRPPTRISFAQASSARWRRSFITMRWIW